MHWIYVFNVRKKKKTKSEKKTEISRNSPFTQKGELNNKNRHREVKQRQKKTLDSHHFLKTGASAQ